MNKTFYKSWNTVKNSSREEILWDQIRHYVSTYGTGFQGEIYIPEDVLEVPNSKVVLKVIKGYTPEEMTEKCLDLLRFGIAMGTGDYN